MAPMGAVGGATGAMGVGAVGGATRMVDCSMEMGRAEAGPPLVMLVMDAPRPNELMSGDCCISENCTILSSMLQQHHKLSSCLLSRVNNALCYGIGPKCTC